MIWLGRAIDQQIFDKVCSTMESFFFRSIQFQSRIYRDIDWFCTKKAYIFNEAKGIIYCLCDKKRPVEFLVNSRSRKNLRCLTCLLRGTFLFTVFFSSCMWVVFAHVIIMSSTYMRSAMKGFIFAFDKQGVVSFRLLKFQRNLKGRELDKPLSRSLF